MAAQNQFADWYNDIPQMTKYWFTADVILPMAAKLGLVGLGNLALFLQPEVNLVWENFHIWRPITSLFAYPITPQTGFHYLMMLYFLYQYSNRLEKDDFAGKPADMSYMLLIIYAVTIVIGFIMKMAFLFEIPIMAVLYVWCQLNKNMQVRFFFGIQLQAQYLPWVLCLFNMIVKGGGMIELIGIFVGHVYYFLKFRYAQDFGGPDLLKTPQWLIEYFPNQRPGVSGFGSAPSRAQPSAPPQNRGSFFGRGRRLGD